MFEILSGDIQFTKKNCHSVIVLFHNSFSPSGEQPEQRILAYKSEQPTAGCIVIFHKYYCYIKYGGIITNLTMKSLVGWLLIGQSTTMWVYGAWIRLYYVLCLKTYSKTPLGALFWTPLVHNRLLGVPVFVRLVEPLCEWVFDGISCARQNYLFLLILSNVNDSPYKPSMSNHTR